MAGGDEKKVVAVDEEKQDIPTDLPPKYEQAGPSSGLVAEDQQTFIRYDTMTSFSGVAAQPTGAIDPSKIDNNNTGFFVANNMVGGALDEPFPVQCPYCHRVVTTKTRHVAGCMTYLACLAVGVLTSFLGCCVIPCCMDRCKDVKHYCPECDQLIAIYKRL